MKRFETLLEKALTPAQQKAKELGLKYRGFGYWQDPKTGKTTYKTEGEELVPIDHEKQQELDDEEDGLVMGDPLNQKDPTSTLPIPPGTNVLGAPEPGMERPTHDQDPDGPEETGWDAGPDGDNMVNDQNKPDDEIPADTYVGSNNNFSWVAGPDGSNFKNLSFDELIDEALQCLTEVRRSQRTQGAKELNSGLNTRGAELLARNKREHDPGPVDAGNTEWHKGGGVGSTDAKIHAKRNRDIQQSASDRKHRREIGAPTVKPQTTKNDPMERTSYWKGEGYRTATAQGKARDIRHLPTNAKTKDNKTKFWKDKGFETGDAEDLAKGARDGGPIDNSVPDDLHDEIMGKLLNVLGKTPAAPQKSYTGAETKLRDFQDFVDNPNLRPAGFGSGKTEYDAANAFAKLGQTDQKDQMDQLQDVANKTAPSWARDPDKYRARNVRDALKELPTIPQQKKDEERVKKMNDELKDLLSDPSIDLDFSSLTGSGGGAFGSTYHTPDKKNIIKNGKIGAKELIALHKLKDSPYFPTLMNAMFETPFTHQSSYKNNPLGRPSMARDPGTENYDFSGDSEGWPIPTARGTYAMSRATGNPYSKIRNNYYGEDARNRVANIWRAREALHRAGISHNDMHGSNIFMDDEGNPTIIDLGLSNDDPMSAFQEALGGFSDRDYQLATGAHFEDLPQEIQDKLTQNVQNIKTKLRERFKIGDIYDPDVDYWGANNDFEMFLNGGIRLTEDDLKEMREKYDLSDEEIIDYIGQLYDGLTPKEESELEKRMSAAYDQRVNDNAVMHNANAVRDRRGAPPLTLPRNVVPSKNLDRSSKSFYHDD